MEELDFEHATALVEGKYAFEARAWQQHQDQPRTGICDYTRNLFGIHESVDRAR